MLVTLMKAKLHRATVTQAEVNRLHTDHLGQADIIIVVDEDVPGTY